MRLYKPTSMDRATCDRSVRCVVHGEDDAPANSHRDVQLIVPSSPAVFAGLFHAEVNVTDEVGSDRNYNLAPLSSGIRIKFRLNPTQTLWIMADDSLGFCAVIVEYIEE